MTNLENIKFEILVSTMNRDSLDFLTKMFPVNYLNYNILIVNQTVGNTIKKPVNSNIRVINSNTKGLAQSRNIALENAKGKVCLIADDDVFYNFNIEEIITNSFKTNTEADIITFKMKDLNGKDFKTYTKSKWHDLESLRQVNSVVIAFKLKQIRDKNVFFNLNFGLGSTFETADEYIFLRDCLKQDLKLWFQSDYILYHDFNSSGRASGSNRLVFARSALFYKYHGFKAYLKLVHYLLLVSAKGYIKNKDFFKKLKTGLQGIATYKKLLKVGQETR